MSLPNVWHHRRVAESAAKACWICFKPSNSVLITPDNKDFFYICAGHLKDRQFCRADEDEVAAVAAKKAKEDLDREIELVKQEYEEKQKRTRERRKEKAKEKGIDKGKDKEIKKNDEEEDTKDEKEKDDKESDCKFIKELSKAKDAPKADDGPRIYSLQKNFYQMRLDRQRNAEVAKRNRERLKNPSVFPSAPSGDL